MAKKSQTAPSTETPATPAEATPEVIATEVEYGGFKHTIADFSVKSAVYLMQYGWAKSLQDSVAGRKKELAEEKNEDGSLKYDEAGVSAVLKTEMGERAAAIIAGTVGTRGPGKPKATTREGMILKVAREWLSFAAKKADKKLPKIGEGYEALLEKYTASKKAEIEAEADRRMATATAPEGETFTFD